MLQLHRKQTIIDEIHKRGGLASWRQPNAASSMMVCFLGECNIHEFAYNFHAYKSRLTIICIQLTCILGFPIL